MQDATHHDEATHQMSNSRNNDQSTDRGTDQFELPLEGRAEAPRVRRSGEVMSATQGEVRSGNDDLCLPEHAMDHVMERVVERGNLLRALKRVEQNKGSPGVDGLTVEELPEYLRKHWPAIREQLLMGRYQPSVVKAS